MDLFYQQFEERVNHRLVRKKTPLREHLENQKNRTCSYFVHYRNSNSDKRVIIPDTKKWRIYFSPPDNKFIIEMTRDFWFEDLDQSVALECIEDVIELIYSAYENEVEIITLMPNPPHAEKPIKHSYPEEPKIDPRQRINHLLIKSHIKIEDMYDLTPSEFELFIGELFKHRLGCKYELTAGPNDNGADLFLFHKDKKIIVQCKRYKGSVPAKMVRELIGTRLIHHADSAILITTGYFSNGAKENADLFDSIVLIDGYQLEKLINENDLRCRKYRGISS